MEKSINEPELVYIQWVDAHSDNAWATKQEIDEYCKGKTVIHEVGWILSETKDSIVIASQIVDDGDIGNRTRIPKVWLTKREKLTHGKRRNKRPPH